MIEEIEKTIGLEGGYVFDEDDAGGETRFGISKRAYPDEDIKGMTKERAAMIYERDYWNKAGCPNMTNLNYRWKIFDIAVNQGVSTSLLFQSQVKNPNSDTGVWELCECQMRKYIAIVVSHPEQIKFLKGWTNRAFNRGMYSGAIT